MSSSRIFATFGLLCGVALVIGWQSLAYRMVYDDLHLIRHYSGDEIRGAFAGDWDPEHIETSGFRPFTTLFNHARYHVFGENVVGHRLLLLVMFAMFLTMLVWIAARVGVGWGPALTAAVVCLCTVHTVLHYAWITDGNHILQGVFIGVAGVALLKGLETRRTALLVAALVFMAAALMVREDSLGAVPVLVLVALVRALDLGRKEVLKTLLIWVAAAGALGAALFAYRKVVVPYAPNPGTNWLSFLQWRSELFEQLLQCQSHRTWADRAAWNWLVDYRDSWEGPGAEDAL